MAWLFVRARTASRRAVLRRPIRSSLLARTPEADRQVVALRKAGAVTDSLVAEQDGKLAGHVAVSPVAISDGSAGWYGLGPISLGTESGLVLPDVPPEYFQAIPSRASLPRGVVTYHAAFSDPVRSVSQQTKEARP